MLKKTIYLLIRQSSNLFFKIKTYNPFLFSQPNNNKLKYINRIVGLKHKIGNYNFKYKFLLNKYRTKTGTLLNYNENINKIVYTNTPKLSQYGFLLDRCKPSQNFNLKSNPYSCNITVECSTRLTPFLKGKLLYCLDSNQLWIKLKLI